MKTARIVRPKTAFALSGDGRKRPRVEDGRHLAYIRDLPCTVCGGESDVHAAHVRYGSLHHGKPATGAGEKPSDRWTVPLCAGHHLNGPDAQHKNGERVWWVTLNIDPLVIAALLYAASGDLEAGRQVISAARTGFYRHPERIQ